MHLIALLFGAAGAVVLLFALCGGRLRWLLVSALSGAAAFFAASNVKFLLFLKYGAIIFSIASNLYCLLSPVIIGTVNVSLLI